MKHSLLLLIAPIALMSASLSWGDEPRSLPSPVPQQAGISGQSNGDVRETGERAKAKPENVEPKGPPPGVAENSDRTGS